MNQSYEAMSILPATPRIGAEVWDLDITRPLNPRQVEDMHRALAHLAVWDYFPHVRSGYRVTIKGARPF